METDEEGVVVAECSNCQFYITEPYEIDGVTYVRSCGECRRYPPKRIDSTMSGFPYVEDDWWCGEHLKLDDTEVTN